MGTRISKSYLPSFMQFLKLCGKADLLPYQVTMLEALLSSSDWPLVSAGLARSARTAMSMTAVGTSPLRGFTPSNIIMDELQ